MKTDAPSYHGYRFPPEIISHAVWLYHRFCVSFRNVCGSTAQDAVRCDANIVGPIETMILLVEIEAG